MISIQLQFTCESFPELLIFFLESSKFPEKGRLNVCLKNHLEQASEVACKVTILKSSRAFHY